MRLLEYQSKKLLAGFGLPVTEPLVAGTAAEVQRCAAQIAGPTVLKAQVAFGGRGTAGAVKFASDATEAAEAAEVLLRMNLRGHAITTISIEPRISFRREFYAGMTWDTSAKLPVALLSCDGGVDVENSFRVARRHFDPRGELEAFAGREMAREMGLQGRTLVSAGELLAQLSRAFLACDALTIEINPVVETAEGEWLGLDAHVEIDEDALVRQAGRLEALGSIKEAAVAGRPLTKMELEAQRIDGTDHRGVAGRVVEFDGDMALLIGGGGASLTVFDAVRRHGGRPANYCEVGGNPTEGKVAALTTLLLAKPGVRGLAVIMNVVNNTRADVMARGVIMGIRQAGKSPAEVIRVFRIPGSWEEEAAAILAAEGVKALGREISLEEASRLAVERSRTYAA